MSGERKSEEPVLDVPSIFERLRGLYGVRTDVALAEQLGTPHGTMMTWKKRGMLPLSFIVEQSKVKSVSVDYLLFGSTGRRTAVPSEINVDVLSVTIEKMLNSKSIKGSTLRQAADLVASLYRFAMELSLKSDLMRVAGPQERIRILREEFGIYEDEEGLDKAGQLSEVAKKLRKPRKGSGKDVVVDDGPED